MKKLDIGDQIEVNHGDNYPYDLLPDNAHFEHRGNIGNDYDGLTSILEVVEDE